MHSIFNQLSKTPLNKLTLYIVFASLLVASQVQYIQHGWINPDSVLYFEAATLFSSGQWKAGFDVFNWPFYSLCIAAFHKLTTLSTHQSAQFLNVIFYCIATFSYIKLIELAGGRQTEFFAGALLWFGSQYLTGGVLEMLMRDEGFWACYLTALVFFVRYFKEKQLTNALLWQLCIILATLFRIEAFSFLALLPLCLLLKKDSTYTERVYLFLRAHIINIGIFSTLVWIIFIKKMFPEKTIGRLNEILSTNLFEELTEKFVTKSQIMSSEVLGHYLNEYATIGLVLTLTLIVFIKIVSSTGIVQCILAVKALRHKPSLLDDNARIVLIAASSIGFLNMVIIITKVFVLSGRYVLALSMMMMVFASFYLAELLSVAYRNTDQWKRWTSNFLILWFALNLINSIIPKHEGYNYIRDAVYWLKHESKLDGATFYDEPRARFYANEPFIGTWSDNWALTTEKIKDRTIHQYSTLVLNIHIEDTQHEMLIKSDLSDFKEIKRFYNAKHKKYVAIYHKQSPPPNR